MAAGIGESFVICSPANINLNLMFCSRQTAKIDIESNFFSPSSPGKL